jgi:hypothetical protein
MNQSYFMRASTIGKRHSWLTQGHVAFRVLPFPLVVPVVFGASACRTRETADASSRGRLLWRSQRWLTVCTHTGS